MLLAPMPRVIVLFRFVYVDTAKSRPLCFKKPHQALLTLEAFEVTRGYPFIARQFFKAVCMDESD